MEDNKTKEPNYWDIGYQANTGTNTVSTATTVSVPYGFGAASSPPQVLILKQML